MNKVFPPEFERYWNDPATRAAWISADEDHNQIGCDNCNGRGFFVLTLAIGGPFETPSLKGVCHWANGKWWSVVNRVADCPVCKNNPRKDAGPIVQFPNNTEKLFQDLAAAKSRSRSPLPSTLHAGAGADGASGVRD
jgi:hypothetical protein